MVYVLRSIHNPKDTGADVFNTFSEAVKHISTTGQYVEEVDMIDPIWVIMTEDGNYVNTELNEETPFCDQASLYYSYEDALKVELLEGEFITLLCNWKMQ